MSRPARRSIRSLVAGDQQDPAEEERQASPPTPTAPVVAAPVAVAPPERREPIVETQTFAHTQEQPAAEEILRMKTGFTLRKDLLKAVKRLAVEEEVDINVLLEEGMQLVLDSRAHA